MVMSEEIRQYLEEVVRTIGGRLKARANLSRYYGGMKRQWEVRLLERAKEILKANPRQTP